MLESSEALLEALPAFGVEERFGAGSTIFEQGSSATRAFLILSGTASLWVLHPELAQPIRTGEHGPGDVLAIAALSRPAEQAFRAVAETDVCGVYLGPQSLAALAETRPELAAWLALRLVSQTASGVEQRERAERARAVELAPDPELDELLRHARTAQIAFSKLDDARVDALLEHLGKVVSDRAEYFAEQEVLATGIGSAADKAHKLRIVCDLVVAELRGVRAVGKLGTTSEGIEEYGSPMGVVFGISPATNPIPNSLFKILTCLKTRNALLLSYPRKAARLGAEFVSLVREELISFGVLPTLIAQLGTSSGRVRVERLLKHRGVDLVLATGGPAVVRAAYSSGKPAYGVGPGNVPALIAADADLERAAEQIFQSKLYDHGIICGSENNLVVDASVELPFIEALTRRGAAVLDAAEKARALPIWFDPETRKLSRKFLGQPAACMAEAAGIVRSQPIRLIVVPTEPEEDELLGKEKMAPIVSWFVVRGVDQALARCARLLELDGAGHTAVIHTETPSLVARFAEMMPAGRILVNTPSTFGMMGVSTRLPTSFVVGSGTFGGNSTTDGITFRHLLNIKRVARHAFDVDTKARKIIK